MDEITLRKALATLRAFADNFPKKQSTVDERYVQLFHSLLADIGNEIGEDLNYFAIPESEIKRRWIATTGDQDFYTNDRKVDTEMMMIKVNGALNFIASFLSPPDRRIIGFSS